MPSSTETLAAEALLGVAMRSAEKLWNRGHILRLSLADGRSVVLKRRTAPDDLGFTAELAVLSFLNEMPVPVAPRLIAANDSLLVMEDLGPASSLAHSLLAGDRDRAGADLVAYARALGTMHSWSFGRHAEFASHVAAGTRPEPHWLAYLAKGKEPFLRAAARLGVPSEGAESEIDSLPELMGGPDGAFTGLVHSDACPDNTYIPPGGGDCRLFDFETSGWGPVALDFGYLLAPFPSCWCFASLPAPVADPAMAAYREIMTSAGVALGPSWDLAVTAALGAVIVARGPAFGHALDEDRDWGTTTARPRALTWLASFIDAATGYAALPHLRSVAAEMHARLSARWPDTVTPDYPALARSGVPLAQIPEDFAAAD